MEQIIFRNVTRVAFKQLNKIVLKKDKFRPQFTGVFLDLNKSKLVVTNTHSLFSYDIKITNDPENPELENIVIDPKIFNESNWLSVPKEDAEFVEFHVSKEKTEVILNDEIVAVAKNIEHENPFPVNWSHVVERKFPKDEVDVDPKLFTLAIGAIPAGFTPTIKFGEKIMITGSMDVEEFGNVGFVGVVMPLNFAENNILNRSEVIDVNERIIGRKTSRRVINSWTEKFVDEDTGESIDIKRQEILIEADTDIDSGLLDLLEKFNVKTIMVHKLE